jgi:Fur family ferric uptake transcriptional regulator
MPKRDAVALAEDIVEQLRPQGFRRTAGLVTLLTEMAAHHRPVTLAELGELPSLAGRDQATVYRLIMKLEEAGTVRRVGFHGRSMHFQLVIGGHHHDYLVCKSCGDIAELQIDCPVTPVEREVANKSGWRDVHHELEFFGVCPDCSRSAS